MWQQCIGSHILNHAYQTTQEVVIYWYLHPTVNLRLWSFVLNAVFVSVWLEQKDELHQLMILYDFLINMSWPTVDLSFFRRAVWLWLLVSLLLTSHFESLGLSLWYITPKTAQSFNLLDKMPHPLLHLTHRKYPGSHISIALSQKRNQKSWGTEENLSWFERRCQTRAPVVQELRSPWLLWNESNVLEHAIWDVMKSDC